GGRPTGWGEYVAAAGIIRVILDADSGIVWGSGSVRSPLFYDTDNTGYYIDPASTSIVSKIGQGGGTTYGLGIGSNVNSGSFDTVDSGVNADPLELVYYSGSSVYVGSGGSKPIYAAILYDGNNNGYYADPASTS